MLPNYSHFHAIFRGNLPKKRLGSPSGISWVHHCNFDDKVFLSECSTYFISNVSLEYTEAQVMEFMTLSSHYGELALLFLKT